MVLSAREELALEQFKSRLMQELDGRLVELKLFGSKARGDDRPGSDVDVLVVIATDDWHVCDTIYEIATDIFLLTDTCISPKIISKSRYDQLRKENASFLINVTRDAITL